MQSSFARCECYAREYSSTLCSLWRLLLSRRCCSLILCASHHISSSGCCLFRGHTFFLSFFLSFFQCLCVCLQCARERVCSICLFFRLSTTTATGAHSLATVGGNSGGGYCTLVQFSWRQKKKKKKSLCQTEFCSALMRSYDKPSFSLITCSKPKLASVFTASICHQRLILLQSFLHHLDLIIVKLPFKAFQTLNSTQVCLISISLCRNFCFLFLYTFSPI